MDNRRRALITGATSGIGMAVAEQFANLGIDLILCGRREDRLREISEQLSDKVDVLTLSFDVRDRDKVAESIGSIKSRGYSIDILINSAGNAHGLGPLDGGDIDDWDAMIDGNVSGLLYVSKAIIPLMREQGSGHIVNLSSVAGKTTYSNGVVYCASKKAVEAISEGMRMELTKYGIKVTNIAPGAVETEFSLVRFKGDEERASKVYEGYTALRAVDVADVITYAVNAPKHVTIADLLILPSAQSQATTIERK